MKTWSGSWDVKALIWSIKCSFYFMITLPGSPFIAPTESICTATVLKKSPLISFLPFFSFLHLTRWKRLGVRRDQCVWKSHSILLGCSLPTLCWKVWLLQELNETSRPCFSARFLCSLSCSSFTLLSPSSPLLPATLHAHMCTKRKPWREISDAQMAQN